MSLDDWHHVFVSICLILILSVCVQVIMTYHVHAQEEKFFEMAVLGKEGMVEHYYPGDDANITVGDEVHWILYLYNHMGETKFVAVRVKLLNSTMLSPNSTSCSPSPAPIIFDVKHVLLNNETWLYPLDWSLMKLNKDGNSIVIEELMINGEIFKTDLKAIYGYNFRVVLELWFYDEVSEDLIFKWTSGKQSCCAWNQIWFNTTYTRIS